MKKIYIIIQATILCLGLISNGITKESSYLSKAIKLYDIKKFDEAKIMFEKDLVFNPKSEKAYLYLAKIFNKNDFENEQEMNLNNVLIINPINDEALYMLTILKIKQSDYNQAKELIEKFTLVCQSFCSKKDEINERFDKLTPEDAKDND